jgi:hypothetical protein
MSGCKAISINKVKGVDVAVGCEYVEVGGCKVPVGGLELEYIFGPRLTLSQKFAVPAIDGPNGGRKNKDSR